MIKAVIFDFGGTLAETSTAWDNVSDKISARLDLDDIRVDPIDLEKAIKDTIEYRKEQHSLGLELDSYSFFNHALESLGYSVGPDLTDELEQMVYDEGHIEFYTGVEDVLMELSEEYKLALLSNSWLEAPRQAIRDADLGRWFNVLMCSFDIGIPKPDSRIFWHTLELLGVDASEAVMVGDSLEADVKGAINAGLKAVLIDDGFSEWDGPKVQELSELPELLRSMQV